MIGGMPVGVAVPTTVEGGHDRLHLLFVIGDILLVSGQFGYIDGRMQGEIMPCGEYQAHVHVGTPVAPGPSALPFIGQSVVIERPQGEVAAHGGIDIRHRLAVASVHIVVPEAIGADGGQRLCRQFLVPVLGRDGREERAVLLLPIHQLVDSLAHQGIGTW